MTLNKILNKHGIKGLKIQCRAALNGSPLKGRPLQTASKVYKSRIQCDESVKALKDMRTSYISDFIASKSKDAVYMEELLQKVAKSEVSRVYNSVRVATGVDCEVLWGTGGHQTKRASELDGAGVRFIWIEITDE